MTRVERSRLLARTWSAAAAGLSISVLAACNGGTSGADGGGSGTSGSGTSTSTSYYSPLQEYLSPPSSAGGEQDFAAKDKQVQELIAPCMQQEGFEYIPFVYPSSSVSSGPGQDVQGRDYVAKYGYGVSTFDSSSAPSSSGAEVIDPNQAIVGAMSNSESEAYYAALYGTGMMASAPAATDDPSAAAPNAASTDESSAAATAVTTDASAGSSPAVATSEAKPTDGITPLEDQGCSGKAQAQVYGDRMQGNGDAYAQFEGLWSDYNTLLMSVDSDPRLVAVVTAWAGCMSDAGYPGFVKVQDAADQVNQRWGELNGFNYHSADAGGGAVAVMSAEATMATASTPAAAEITAFHDYEIKIALADFDCKATGNYDTLSNGIRIGLEQKFITDHLDELNRYRDLMNSGR